MPSFLDELISIGGLFEVWQPCAVTQKVSGDKPSHVVPVNNAEPLLIVDIIVVLVNTADGRLHIEQHHFSGLGKQRGKGLEISIDSSAEMPRLAFLKDMRCNRNTNLSSLKT